MGKKVGKKIGILFLLNIKMDCLYSTNLFWYDY